MITRCESQGIYLEPENYQDKLYLAQYYIDVVNEYGGTEKMPSNMELHVNINSVGGCLEHVWEDFFTKEDGHDAWEVANEVTWLFFAAGGL